ncbi:MAG: serine/threonine-protein kinase [Candidatus Delongbacteria bacterium]|jgi:serine/threonine protein kinase|nr:serine/threonine-protein kinase [Candidatus Delongbacteria bacterium]MDD4204625.1 serine/threonine-protein kinase [Candidatus Delongbacteria bacterium]MDY0017192.1 serine/threonine-protein kinase [Candidatus Delongbacteria bacterium]
MEPGSKINDRYEIIRLLGEGGMGNVYLVKDFVENRVVALKLIKDKFFSNKAIDRFKNEFKIVSALKHPNIIKVYDLDVYKETDTYFFTMEFVEGENLTTAFPDLSYKEKLEILLQIARGLNYIHNRHIIHFDIKTDNIFLIKEKEGIKAKIMDFGLANLVEDFSGKVRGTLIYIAPEVLLKKDIDYRVDLYSLGMVIYYIFSGKLPFDECKSVKEIVQRKLEESFREEVAFSSIQENFVKNLIKDLCAARKEDRIHSAQQLILYLETALEMNIREEEERIETIFNNEYYDKTNLLTELQDEYLNFCLRTEKRTGMLISVISENGNGKTQLMDSFNIRSQLNRIPSLYLTVEKEESTVNIFFRKLIFGLIGFLDKNETGSEIFEKANGLINSDGTFVQDKELIFKIRTILKDIFDNLNTKQSILLLIDDITNLEETGKDLMNYIFNIAVTSPLFVILSIDIDLVDREECKLKSYEDIYYLIPPKRYYIENLKIGDVKKYISFLLRTSSDNIDDRIIPYVLKESNGNMFLVKSYLEFLITHKYFNLKEGKYEFEFPENISYHSKILDIYQARFANLSQNEKFIFLFIAGKFDEGANYEKIRHIFDIDDLRSIMSKLQRMSLIDFRIKRGDKYYFIKNENFTKVIRNVSKEDRQSFYDRLTEYYGAKKKRSLITYTYCLIKSSAEGKIKKKQLKETIEYCREHNLNIDRKNFLIFYYKSFNITTKTRISILKDLYLLLISMGSFDEAFIYYKELLKNIKLPKRSPEYAQIISDSICFSRTQISLHKKSEFLQKASSVLKKSGDLDQYLKVLFKRLTFLTRTGRIKICKDLIDHELKKNSSAMDETTRKAVLATGEYFASASLIQKSEIYLKLIHIYKYLEADFVYPNETLDINLTLVFDLIVKRKIRTAAELCETLLKNPSHDLNKVEELTLNYLYANLMLRSGKLKKAYELLSAIEQISVKKAIGNNLITVISDKVEAMTNMRMTASKVDNEYEKAITLGKRFRDYLGLFRIYSKYINFLIGTGRWRDAEINIRFAMNLISKVANKDEIKRFIVSLAYYHYIIKDPEGFTHYKKNILRIYPELENSAGIKLLFSQIELLFSMYSTEVTGKIIQEIPKASSRYIKMLLSMKYFNNSVNNYSDPAERSGLVSHIEELKSSFTDTPHIYDYFDVIESLMNENYAQSLKITVKLGKDNYAKGYIFDSYFPILSSYFYFRNRSQKRNADFFEDKLNLLSEKLMSNMPSEKRENFQTKYWAI